MRKLFFLIPALILSMMMSATRTEISTSTYGTDNVRKALYYSNEGDTIVLTDGTYEESNSGYIAWRRSNVVMAKEGDNVIIKPHVSFRVINGARAELIGVKINASELTSLSGYEDIFQAGDANDGNRLILEGCEIYGNVSKTMLRCASDKKLDSLIINNCYIHDNAQATLRMQSTSLKGVIITNTTIANVANGGSFWCAPMDISSTATDAKVIVDHCTFYHNTSISSSYADITVGYDGSATSDVTVTNCIFAQPASYDGSRAINLVNGGTVRNCLTFNYTKSTNGIQGATVKENCIAVDPLFTDAANGDYSYPGNWVTPSISPARGAATDGSDLGDPRWYSAEILPATCFASDYNLLPTKAMLSGRIELNANDKIHFKHNSVEANGTAKWKLHVEKSCIVSALVDVEAECTSGRQLTLTVKDADGNTIATLAQASATYNDNDIDLGQISFSEEGDYTFILTNSLFDSGVVLEKITLSYVGGDVQAMPGTTKINDAWFSANGTRADGKISFPGSTIQEGWVKWNVNFANAANYKAKVNINCDNGHNYTVALYEDEDDLTPITWGEGGQTEDESPLDLGAKEVPAGNYILKVTNAVQYSHAELVSVQFVNAGGGLVNIPGDITLTEAILSSRAYIDENGEIRFTSDAEHGHVTAESVAWRVNVSKAGYYKFTTSVNSNNGHSYLVSVYNADETVLKGSVPQSGDDIWGASKTFSTDNIYLEEGEYRVKVQNTTNNSNGRIVSISASYEGGAVDTIPGTIDLADALLSDRAYRDNDGLHFTDADHYYCIANESATWNIYATAGVYDFTLNVVGTNHGIYQLIVKDSQDNEIANKEKGKSGSGSVEIKSVFFPADGNYTIRLANVNNHADGYLTVLSAAKQDVVVLDEAATNNSVLTANYNVSKNFILKRTFKGGMYNTICLPFEIGSQGTMESIFGVGYELVKLSDATISPAGVLTVEVENSITLEHGVPYFIKPAADIVNPVFNNRKIKDTEMSDFSRGDVDFVGTFIKSEIPASEYNLFLGENNLLYFPMADTPIKGYRAYFRINNSNSAPVRQARIVTREQVITEIDLVGEENNTVKTIENGQLIIIKNGIRYNVMGAKIQ